MEHVGDAGADRVEGLERAHERAGREHFDPDATAAGSPIVCARRTALAWRPGSPCGPVGHHLELAQPLRERREPESSAATPAAAIPAPARRSRRLMADPPQIRRRARRPVRSGRGRMAIIDPRPCAANGFGFKLDRSNRRGSGP